MKSLISLLLLFFAIFSYANNPSYFFRHITVDDGLAHTDVTEVLQDELGFLWIGTTGGLQRYDGRNLELFWNDQNQLGAVYNNRIRHISLDNNRKLWLATEGGLKCFDVTTNAFVDLVPTGAEDTEILATETLRVHIGAENEIYLINVNGLYRVEFNGPDVKNYVCLYSKNLQGNFGADIYMSGNYLVAAFIDELIFVEKEKLSNRNIAFPVVVRSQKNEIIRSFYCIENAENNLLVGTNDGFLELNPDEVNLVDQTINGTFHTISQQLMTDSRSPGKGLRVTDIKKVNEGYWVASNEGLLLANEENGGYEFSVYRRIDFDKNSLSVNMISSLFIDQYQNLWIGTFGGGLNYLDLNQKQFSLISTNPFNPKKSLSENFVRAILEDHQGNLWLGTRSSGLNKYDRTTNQIECYNKNNHEHLLSDNIRCLVEDQNKRIWIGTDRGLNIYYPGEDRFVGLTPENTGNRLSGDTFFALDVDIFGRVWAGTWSYNGINVIKHTDSGEFEIDHLTEKDNGLCSDRITYILADKSRPEVLVATNKGLNHIFLNQDGSIKNVYKYIGYENDSTSLSSNYIWPIVRSNDTTLWVGTLGGGLNKLILEGHGGYRAIKFGINEGAPSNDIESIQMDNEGNLWLGTRGLSFFNTSSYTFINYDTNDGLQGNSFKIGSSYQGRDGTMYFGGTNGVSYFDPANITKSTYIPKVAFSNLYVDNKLIRPNVSYDGKVILEQTLGFTNSIELSHLQNNFSIWFASQQFSNHRSKYKYQLVGVDQDWRVTNEPGESAASYSNLDYGTYELLVLGSNSDGVWGQNPTKLSITIRPPIWGTTLAKIGYVLLFFTLLGLAFYLQKRWLGLKKNLEFTLLEEQKMEYMHKMRLRFFTNISHEFKTPLTLIIGPLQRLLAGDLSNEERTKLFTLVNGNANRLLKLVNELMDFRKVEAGFHKLQVAPGNLKKVIKEITKGFEEMALQKKLKFNTRINLNKSSQYWFDQGFLEKILLNLITNAFRYTESGAITVEVGEDPIILHSTLANHHCEQSKVKIDAHFYIKISDTGKGITKASLANIFDRYYRISDSESSHTGSGVGLALVKSLVLKHKGTIHVYTERRVGTEFIVCLPLNPNVYQEEDRVHLKKVENVDESISPVGRGRAMEVVDATTELADNGGAGKPYLLLVEDNKELVSFLKDSFSPKYRVQTASNGQEALNLIYQQTPDIVISDIMMPVMNGWELCEALKTDINYSHLPVILLTAKSGDENQIKGMELGADFYFSKPFNLKLLDKTVEKILENRTILKERYRNDTFVEERELVNNRKDQEFMDHLIEIINNQMDNPAFDIDHLCMELGNSRTKLYNKIKGLTGLSVGDFIRRMRMKKSAEILLKEDVSVAEVMVRVGIQSQSYFTKTFKKEFGITPAAYCKEMTETSKSG